MGTWCEWLSAASSPRAGVRSCAQRQQWRPAQRRVPPRSGAQAPRGDSVASSSGERGRSSAPQWRGRHAACEALAACDTAPLGRTHARSEQTCGMQRRRSGCSRRGVVIVSCSWQVVPTAAMLQTYGSLTSLSSEVSSCSVVALSIRVATAGVACAGGRPSMTANERTTSCCGGVRPWMAWIREMSHSVMPLRTACAVSTWCRVEEVRGWWCTRGAGQGWSYKVGKHSAETLLGLGK